MEMLFNSIFNCDNARDSGQCRAWVAMAAPPCSLQLSSLMQFTMQE